MNFKTAAKIIFFIQPILRCIGGLQASLSVNLFLSDHKEKCFIKKERMYPYPIAVTMFFA